MKKIVTISMFLILALLLGITIYMIVDDYGNITSDADAQNATTATTKSQDNNIDGVFAEPEETLIPPNLPSLV